jgi:DNA-binding MarR family transcriptional regulator
MDQTLELKLAAFCKDLHELPLAEEDREQVVQFVLGRLGSAVKRPEPASLNKLARDIFRVSHRRNEVLGSACCPDPEWNMLLELVVAHTEERGVAVTNLCIASGVPAATAVRHIDRMADTGLIRRRECATDKRRIWVEPTPRALNATELLLRQVYDAG